MSKPYRDADINERALPLVTVGPIPAHARDPVTPLQKQLAGYPALKEEQRAIIEPRLLAANDLAYSKAINRVLTGFGLDRKSVAVAVEPTPVPGPKSGALVFTFDPFSWLRRLFGRG